MPKRIVCFLLLVLTTILPVANAAPAAPLSSLEPSSQEEAKSEDLVAYDGHGLFSPVSPTGKKAAPTVDGLQGNSNNVYKLKEIGNDVYEIINGSGLPYTKALKVSNGRYQGVNEYKINSKNKTDATKELEQYSLPPYMEEALLSVYEGSSDSNLANATITIYSPESYGITSDTSKADVVTPMLGNTPPVYYTGYNNRQYMDEKLIVDGYLSNVADSNTYTIPTFQAYIREVIGKLVFFGASEGLKKWNPVAGGAATLIDLFYPNLNDSVIDGRPGTAQFTCRFTENKIRKWTSIADGALWKCSAVSDNVWQKWYEDTYYSDFTDLRETETLNNIGAHFNDLDYHAYMNRVNTLQFQDIVSTYTRWKFTFYSSIR